MNLRSVCSLVSPASVCFVSKTPLICAAFCFLYNTPSPVFYCLTLVIFCCIVLLFLDILGSPLVLLRLCFLFLVFYWVVCFGWLVLCFFDYRGLVLYVCCGWVEVSRV